MTGGDARQGQKPPGITLILGGARSGKSSRAQWLAEEAGGTPVYIATAQPLDGEMADRIARHCADRGPGWHTVEAPIALADAIREQGGPGRVLLVDCLTLWLSNLMLADDDIDAASADLIAAITAADCPILLVSNEVGLGIVPDNALARRFRDLAGRLNQQIAAIADRVELIVAGLVIQAK